MKGRRYFYPSAGACHRNVEIYETLSYNYTIFQTKKQIFLLSSAKCLSGLHFLCHHADENAEDFVALADSVTRRINAQTLLC